MHIVKLFAENIKRIKVAEVTPTGELVVVGGKNDAGKSSLLDAIEMAMGGEIATPTKPVRLSAKAGKIVLDLGDIVVTRTYTEGGGRKLVVANKDGARFPSPQAMLDRLYGSLSFDPLAFERLERKAQAEVLRKLVGLDLSILDGKRADLYDERTLANRDVKALEVKVAELVKYDDAPDEEVSLDAIAAEMRVAEDYRRKAEEEERKVEKIERQLDIYTIEARAVTMTIKGLEQQLADERAKLAELEAGRETATLDLAAQTVTAEAARAVVPDPEPIRARLSEVEATNRKVRTNRQHAQAVQALEDARAVSKGLSDQIDEIDAERAAKLAAAAFPVPGLGIDADGVTLNGLPFEQASTSDRIRVSVAIGLAANPTLKVLLVRDGSLLGQEKLELLAQMAREAGAQVWLEMMQEAPDGRTTVFIEDGSVATPDQVAKKKAAI